MPAHTDFNLQPYSFAFTCCYCTYRRQRSLEFATRVNQLSPGCFAVLLSSAQLRRHRVKVSLKQQSVATDYQGRSEILKGYWHEHVTPIKNSVRIWLPCGMQQVRLPTLVHGQHEMYESAKGQMTVTSQQRALPLCHGTSERPSGRFPSERSSPDGYYYYCYDCYCYYYYYFLQCKVQSTLSWIITGALYRISSNVKTKRIAFFKRDLKPDSRCHGITCLRVVCSRL